MSYPTIVLSLGGSLIVPDDVNVSYLKRLRLLLLKLSRQGNRFIVVTGGGDVARHYQGAARNVLRTLPNAELDRVGIAATKLNAELVRAIFGGSAHHEILDNPTKRIASAKRILVGSGWRPGFSSDKDAVLLAHSYGATTVVNMSNIRYVYTADPRRVKTARPLRQMRWRELLKLTGTHWHPGAHVPFDPEAAKLARRWKLTVYVCLGTDLQNLERLLQGKRFIGTTIS